LVVVAVALPLRPAAVDQAVAAVRVVVVVLVHQDKETPEVAAPAEVEHLEEEVLAVQEQMDLEQGGQLQL